jgi:two-component system phosphate regulon sensor histidine kinase PhoR
MTLSLRARLFLTQALLVAGVLALVTALALYQERRWLIDMSAERLERGARAISHQIAVDRVPAERAQDLAETLGNLLGERVTLIDSAGWVRGDSEVELARLPSVENHATRPEVQAALRGRLGRASRLSRTVGVEFVYVAVPTRMPGPFAVVRLAEPLTQISAVSRSLVRLSLTTAGLALLISIPLVLWVARGQAMRARELESVAVRLGSGETGVRARERPADEIGRLGRAINAMAVELRARYSALERERDEREAILAHMTDGVALLDGDGRVAHANRSLATILGAPLPPVPGAPLGDFVRSPELEQLVRTARHTNQPVERDLRLWAPQQRLLRATATRLPGAAEGSVLLVLHDLTEIERLDRVRQDFVANVSHELKTPLTSVRGYAETLLQGGFDDVEHREQFARVIRDQAKRLQELVDDLLSLAELERPGARLRLESFDLREAVERQVAEFRARGARGLRISLEAGPPVPVEADRARVDQVIANLLDNAIKYTEYGDVTVATGARDALVWCEVRDTGPGIAVEHQQRIFERFYRVDPARSRERGGTGLGLSIAKHVVELHGGRITVHSESNQGSTFRFELPERSASKVR